MDTSTIQFRLEQAQGYRFHVHFDDPNIAVLATDEPPPLGTGSGPNPARLLGAAVANCLAASLLFALRKFGNEPSPLHAEVTVAIGRNDRGRMRIQAISVDLRLGVPASALRHADRAVGQYEDFCIVTQSVRPGIPVTARVWDSEGTELSTAPA